MKIFSWNVNGIRAVLKKDTILPFIEEYQPDILCIQESKAQPEQVDLEVPGYHQYWNSAERKGYSGTIIFSRVEPISVKLGFDEDISEKYKLQDDYGDTTAEGRVISAEYEKFWVVTVYTPNAKDDLSRIPMRQQWDPAFLEHCQRLEKDKPVVFCGDLNVAHTEDDLARPKQNVGKKGFTSEERDGIQAFVDAGFVDTFRKYHEGNGYYTWWSHWGKARERNVGWRIDYVFVSAVLASQVTKADIYPQVMGSDHCPVAITLDI